jgi:hypothetical protein
MNEDTINLRVLPPIPPEGGLKSQKILKPPLGGLGVKNKGKKEEYRIEI